MANNDGRLILELEPRLDADNKTYHIAKIKFPGVLDCSKGLAFLVFTSEIGAECLQISEIVPPRDKDRKDTK